MKDMTFREMRRKNKALSEADCLRLLESAKRGVLSVIGDGGYPYGAPVNHYYNEEDGCLYFHGGLAGHRVDAVRANDKASFCVVDDGVPDEGGWALTFCSVIVFGRVEIVEDRETVYRLSAALSRKFTSDEDYIRHEIEKSGPATLMLRLIPEHMTGKRVREE